MEEEAIQFAKKYLEDMLSFFGLNTEVRASCDEDVIELSVPSSSLNGFLIGQRGDTLRALQFMASSALKAKEYPLTRVNVDIADYKKQREHRLAEQVQIWIKEVVDTKEPKALPPMNAADRRVVHKTVSENPTVVTESVGFGRDRHVIIKLA